MSEGTVSHVVAHILFGLSSQTFAIGRNISKLYVICNPMLHHAM